MEHAESNSITTIRAIATISILLTHIFKYFNIGIYPWLAIGVQIFFCMSGFLLATSEISSLRKWYTKRLIKILVPYYIYIIIVLPLYAVFNPETLSPLNIWTTVFNLQGLIFGIHRIYGLNHLWFLTIIMLCYLLTPFLIFLKNKKYFESNWSILRSIIIFALLFQIISFIIIEPFLASWITCFFSGFIVRLRMQNHEQGIKYPIRVLFFLNILTLPILFYLKYIYVFNNDLFKNAFILFEYWSNAFLGIFLFFILFTFFKSIQLKSQLINTINKYSYEIYITHNIYILSAFSLLSFNYSPLVGIMSVLVATGVSSVGLKIFSDMFINKIWQKIYIK